MVFAAAGAAHAAVYVYHVGTAKVVATLRGHAVNVRSLHYDAASNKLVTCSFDKTVKVYEQP
jgi:WD40 repeat protein